MNFRILAASVRPRGRFFALLAATALTATLLVPDAQAQQPAPEAAPKAKAAPKSAPKAAPKAAPAAPAPAAQQAPPPANGAPAANGQPQDQQVQLIYAPWTKFCLKGQDANAKQVCFTGKDGRIESGQPVIAAVIIEPEGEPKKILRVTLPLSMPGVVAGTILVFIPVMGTFIVSDILGGRQVILVGNLIQRQFLDARDPTFGSAASLILMVLTLIVTYFYTRKFGFGEEIVVA